MEDSWILSITVYIYPPDKIANETSQTRERVSSLMVVSLQSNGGVIERRRGVKLCGVQSIWYTGGPSNPKAHIDDDPLNSSHADTY